MANNSVYRGETEELRKCYSFFMMLISRIIIEVAKECCDMCVQWQYYHHVDGETPGCEGGAAFKMKEVNQGEANGCEGCSDCEECKIKGDNDVLSHLATTLGTIFLCLNTIFQHPNV